MNIIGYCKECSTIIRHEDRIDDTQIYECSKCKHPQTKEEVEFGPFEVKRSGENIVIQDLSKYSTNELIAEVQRRKTPIKPYEPMCPFGYDDCVCDCNYIKHYYPDWYECLGRPTECECEDGDGYDDEDK